MKKILRTSAKLGAALFLLANLILLYFGIGSPLTTLAVYGFLTWLGLKILQLATRKSKNKARIQNLRLLILSTFIALFVGEMAIRFVFRAGLSYREENGSWFYLSPYRQVVLENFLRRHYLGEEDPSLRIRPPHSSYGYHKGEFSFVHRYNNEGVRGADFSREKPPHTLRVLTFGDSFTEGVGAAEDSTWPALLEGRLRAELGGKKVEVLNFGASGSDVVFEFDKLKKIGLKYQPDWVILALNSSDIDDLVVRGGRERYLPDQRLQYRKAPAAEYLYSFSYLFRLLYSLGGEPNAFLLSPEEYANRKEEAKEIILEELKAFQQLGDEEGFAFQAVFHPLMQELEGGQIQLHGVHQGFTPHPPHGKVNVLEAWIHADMQPEEIIRRCYWPSDRHHNGRGYAALAEVVGDSVGEGNP